MKSIIEHICKEVFGDCQKHVEEDFFVMFFPKLNRAFAEWEDTAIWIDAAGINDAIEQAMHQFNKQFLHDYTKRFHYA